MKVLLGSVLSMAVVLGLCLQAEAIPFTNTFEFANFTNVQFSGGQLNFTQGGLQNINCPWCESLNLSTMNATNLGVGPGFSLQNITGIDLQATLYNEHTNNAVPIPGTMLLFGAGFASFVAWQSRRKEPLA